MAFRSQPQTTPVTASVRVVSKCMVKPAFIPGESNKPYYLAPWNALLLNYECIQFGLLFNKPNQSMNTILDRLKSSLAITLTHFIPLSGRFVTQHIQHPPSYCVYVDCKDPPGAGFVHTVSSSLIISDILAPIYVPRNIIKSLFALPFGTRNSQGHTLPFFAVQVNELVDGIFIGFSANHALVDGVSLWHFINSYSEVCRSNSKQFVLSRPPVMSPGFTEDQCRISGSHPSLSSDGIFTMPPDDAIRQRVFHFTSTALTRLKAKANDDFHTHKISTYQALSALIWRAITRARRLTGDQLTTCVVPVSYRTRVEPSLSDVYFGNVFMPEYVTSTASDLLTNNLGWAASKLHDRISQCDNNRVRFYLEHFDELTLPEDANMVFLGSSPRFDIYGNDFGWGNPVAVRWPGDVYDGIVHVLPGREIGSIDLIIDLFSGYMNALEADPEFIDALSATTLSKL